MSTWLMILLLLTSQPATTPATAPTTRRVEVNLSTPLDAMRSSARAMRDGDGDAFAACADAIDDKGRRSLAAMGRWVTSGGRLERAVRARFGEAQSVNVLDAVPVVFNPWGIGAFGLEELERARPEDVRIQGDRATLRTRNVEMVVKRVGNQWKLPMPGGGDAPDVPVELYARAADLYERIAQQIESGKYTDANDAAEQIGKMGAALPAVPATQGR